MSNLKDHFDKVKQDYEKVKSDFSTGNCWVLSTTLSDFEGEMREHIQQITGDKIDAIIQKLQKKTLLDPEDLEYIKLWIVGDADYYVKMENNYNDWVQELERLIALYGQMEKDSLVFSEAAKLRAMLLDGVRVLGDIVFFLKQKERIKNFTESTEELDDDERDLLIRLLSGKKLSPNE